MPNLKKHQLHLIRNQEVKLSKAVLFFLALFLECLTLVKTYVKGVIACFMHIPKSSKGLKASKTWGFQHLSFDLRVCVHAPLSHSCLHSPSLEMCWGSSKASFCSYFWYFGLHFKELNIPHSIAFEIQPLEEVLVGSPFYTISTGYSTCSEHGGPGLISLSGYMDLNPYILLASQVPEPPG